MEKAGGRVRIPDPDAAGQVMRLDQATPAETCFGVSYKRMEKNQKSLAAPSLLQSQASQRVGNSDSK